MIPGTSLRHEPTPPGGGAELLPRWSSPCGPRYRRLPRSYARLLKQSGRASSLTLR